MVDSLPNKIVDFGERAEDYDKSRALSVTKEIIWVRLFSEHFLLKPTCRVLDVGCGTGRFALSMKEHFGSWVVGLDPSVKMLSQVKNKANKHVKLVMGYAEALPFQHDSFDVCLASQIFHHLADKMKALREIYRVLSIGGRIGIRYSSHAQLRVYLDYRFFPTALEIDLARMPDTSHFVKMLETVGFGEITEKFVRQEIYQSAEDYLEKLRLKYSSVLTLISEEEHAKGLEAARAYFQSHVCEEDRIEEMTFLVATK